MTTQHITQDQIDAEVSKLDPIFLDAPNGFLLSFASAAIQWDRDQRAKELPVLEPMTEVADRYAHRLALELECVLADRPGYYDSAMQVLGEYRSAMNEIHERHSPTFMGEPLLPKEHQ